MKAELTSSRGLQTHSVPRTCPDPTPDALDTTLDHCRWGPAYQLCLESHAPIQHRRNHHKLGWLQLQWCPDAAPPAYPLQYRAQQPPPLPNLHAPPTINRHIPDNNAKPSQAPVVMQPPPEHQHPPTPTQPLNKIAGGAGDPATQHPATPATQPPPQTDRPTTRTPPAVGTQQPPAAPTTNTTPPANHATPDDTTMDNTSPDAGAASPTNTNTSAAPPDADDPPRHRTEAELTTGGKQKWKWEWKQWNRQWGGQRPEPRDQGGPGWGFLYSQRNYPAGATPASQTASTAGAGGATDHEHDRALFRGILDQAGRPWQPNTHEPTHRMLPTTLLPFRAQPRLVSRKAVCPLRQEEGAIRLWSLPGRVVRQPGVRLPL